MKELSGLYLAVTALVLGLFIGCAFVAPAIGAPARGRAVSVLCRDLHPTKGSGHFVGFVCLETWTQPDAEDPLAWGAIITRSTST